MDKQALSTRAPALVLSAVVMLGIGVGGGVGSAEPAPDRLDRSTFGGEGGGQQQVASGSRADRPPAPAPRAERVRPVAGPMTGWFGESRSGHWHPGVDLDGETGDPVVVAAAGVVAHSGPAPQGYGGYGNLVVIHHPDGSQTLYAHLASVAVGTGQVLAPGQLLGAMGSTGWSTGSHLHFEVRWGGVPIDPMAWLAEASVPLSATVPDLALGA